MARRVVVLVVVLFAIAGIVLAEPPKPSPGGSASTPAAEGPDSIGPVDDPAGAEGGDDVVEGPVGGPTPLGEYGAAATAPAGASDAASVKISAGVGAAAALAGLFF